MKVKNKKILIFISAIVILLTSTWTNLGIISSVVYATMEDISISENEDSGKKEVVSDEESINKTEENENISNIDKLIEDNIEKNIVDSSIKIDTENSNNIENDDVEGILEYEDLLLTEDYEVMPLANSGETSSVQYYGSVSYGGSKVGNFAVNGKQAFCMIHAKKTPPSGTAITSSIYNNENIAKCLYYGWNGDGQWAGFTSGNMGIVMTSLALDYFYNGNTHKVANPFINFVNSQTLPILKFSFSNPNLTGIKINDYEQATDTITLIGDSRYSISFTLQDGVQLHNITKGAVYNGRVTLNGGDSFFLVAPIDIKGSWTSENIGNAAYKYSTIIWTSGNSNYQQLGQQLSPEVDPTHYINLTINWDNSAGETPVEPVEPPENPTEIEITKTDETGRAVSGATFRIWTDDGYNKIARTDASGKIILNDIDSTKTVYYQEISAPYGYLLDDTIHTIDKTEPIINREPTGNLTVTKSDSLTGNSMRIDNTYHHGDASIAGSEYTLYANQRITNRSGSITYFNKGDEVATFLFDERGIATINLLSYKGKLRVNGSTLTGIPLGNYSMEETFVPEGYTKDTRTYTYNFTYANQYTSVINKYGYVYNAVKTEPFEIIKISSDTNDTAQLIENAEFTAILERYVNFYGSFEEALKHTEEYAFDEWCTMTTDKKGYAISDRLAYRYICSE